MNNGWIKLHRSLLDWEWFSEPNTMRLFLYCLLKANHADGRWQGICVNSGQFITSIDSLSTATGLSNRQIRTALKNLISTGEVTKHSTSKYSIISITNWNEYQEGDKPDDKQATSDRQSGDKRATTNKNDKNSNNDKNEDLFCAFWENYPRKTNKKKARTSFLNLTEEKMLLAIEDCLSRYANTEKRFIPHATTYLNGERFYDEVITHEETGNRSRSDTAAAVGSLFEKEANAAARRLSEGPDSEVQSYIPAKVGRAIQNH